MDEEKGKNNREWKRDIQIYLELEKSFRVMGFKAWRLLMDKIQSNPRATGVLLWLLRCCLP